MSSKKLPIKKSQDVLVVTETDVYAKIAVIRKQQVIADADVADLYGVETRVVNQAVRNNPDKFPSDYRFELTRSELHDLKSQILISSLHGEGSLYAGDHFEKREGCGRDFRHHRDFYEGAGLEARACGVAQRDRQAGAGREDEAFRRGPFRYSDARLADSRN